MVDVILELEFGVLFFVLFVMNEFCDVFGDIGEQGVFVVVFRVVIE